MHPCNELNSSFTVTNCEQREARNGQNYLRLNLENSFQSVTANCWPNSYQGPDSFSKHDIVQIVGIRKYLDFREIVDIHRAQIIMPTGEAALTSLRKSCAPNPDDLQQLIKLVASIQNEALRDFVYSAFSDRDFASRFIRLPASHQNHHAYRGGLLRHSLECAVTASQCVTNSDINRDLVTVAALFHDVGKVLTMQDQKKTPLGYLVDHDSLTLTVLNGPLTQLDTAWENAGLALRHIWTCRSIKQWGFRAKTYLADVVQMADRISAATDCEQQAFLNVEAWRNNARHSQSDQRYWRLLPPDQGEQYPHQYPTGVYHAKAG